MQSQLGLSSAKTGEKKFNTLCQILFFLVIEFLNNVLAQRSINSDTCGINTAHLFIMHLYQFHELALEISFMRHQPLRSNLTMTKKYVINVKNEFRHRQPIYSLHFSVCNKRIRHRASEENFLKCRFISTQNLVQFQEKSCLFFP